MLNSFDQALDYLFNKRASNKDLNRIKYFINKYDLTPKCKVITVTGTNGKGSVANYIKNILKNANMHVGCFTSPFVDIFNERIMINDRYISNAEVMYYLNFMLEDINLYENKNNTSLSFFEIVLLMALMFFRDRNIDLLVLEVGIGGLNDYTNVIDNNISIITNIGYDHTNVLGNDKLSIANNKLGIVRNDSILISAEKELNSYFKDYCNNRNTNYINVLENITDITIDSFKYKNILYKHNMLGENQAYNIAIAIEAVNQVINNFNIDLLQYGILNTIIPARFEQISDNIIIDGAHNIDAIESLINNLKYYNKNKVIYFASLGDKNYENMLKSLDKIASRFIFSNIDDSRKTNPNLFIKYITKPYEIYESIQEANNNIKLNENEILIITGSLHFASLYKKNIKK